MGERKTISILQLNFKNCVLGTGICEVNFQQMIYVCLGVNCSTQKLPSN